MPRYLHSVFVLVAGILLMTSLHANAMSHQEARQLAIKASMGDAKALKTLQQQARAGKAPAENWLGVYYDAGKNYVKANAWYEKASRQGSASAEFNLGLSYYYGQGVPQNTKTAIQWWKKAADQGGRAGRRAQHALLVVERPQKS